MSVEWEAVKTYVCGKLNWHEASCCSGTADIFQISSSSSSVMCSSSTPHTPTPPSFFLPPLFPWSLFKLSGPAASFVAVLLAVKSVFNGSTMAACRADLLYSNVTARHYQPAPRLYINTRLAIFHLVLLSTCTFPIVPPWAAANGNCIKTLPQLQQHRPPKRPFNHEVEL